MRYSIGRVVLVVVLTVSSVSCSGDSASTAFHPVHGKVTYKGEPASGAVVTFQPEGTASISKQGTSIVPTGTTGDDGTFTLSCADLGEGAPEGKYKVLITWRPSPKSAAAKQLLAKRRKSPDYDPAALLPGDPFDGRYSNPAKPLLTADIKSGSNEVSFELKD